MRGGSRSDPCLEVDLPQISEAPEPVSHTRRRHMASPAAGCVSELASSMKRTMMHGLRVVGGTGCCSRARVLTIQSISVL